MMQLRNKERLSYYSALTVLLSYAEFMLPHLPFLKFGLGNIIVLSALCFEPADFMLLLMLKSVASSFISGTLFSPFFLISFAQSVCSGFVMYFINGINKRVFKEKLFSVYGISIIGASVSAVVQVFCAALYLGKGVYNILGVMMIFSAAAGLFTAFCSGKISIDKIPELIGDTQIEKNEKNKAALSTFLVILIIFILFFIQKNEVLLICFAVSVVFQFLHHRKFLFLPHLFLWFFIIFASAFSGGGKVLLRIGVFTFYQYSLIVTLKKCLILSSVICVSQCAASIKFTAKGLIALTSNYFYALLNCFYCQSGSVFTRIKTVLNAEKLEFSDVQKNETSSPLILFVIQFVLMSVLFCADFYIRKIK